MILGFGSSVKQAFYCSGDVTKPLVADNEAHTLDVGAFALPVGLHNTTAAITETYPSLLRLASSMCSQHVGNALH